MRLSPPTPPASRAVFFLFAATIFLSALLLFWVQLIIAKMLLPRLGGTPAVWTTCMLFFQVLLLAGYSYVLVTTAWIGPRKQAVLHVVLLLLSSLYLPLTLIGNFGSISGTKLSGSLALRLPANCDRLADLSDFNYQPVIAKVVYTYGSRLGKRSLLPVCC